MAWKWIWNYRESYGLIKLTLLTFIAVISKEKEKKNNDKWNEKKSNEFAPASFGQATPFIYNLP